MRNLLLMSTLMLVTFVALAVDASALHYTLTTKDSFNQTGWQWLANISLKAENETAENMSIEIFSAFDTSLSDNNFDVSNETKIVNVSVNIPSYAPPITTPAFFTAIYIINNTTQRFGDVIDIKVEERKTFTIFPSVINMTFFDGQQGDINASLNNTGNVKMLLNISTADNVFTLPSSIVIYPAVAKTVYFEYSINESMRPGSYNFSVNFTHNNIVKPMIINGEVVDTQPPTYNLQYKKRLKYGEYQQITLTASDNVAVNESYFDLTAPDGEVVSAKDKFKAEKLGEWKINVRVKDESGNTNTTQANFTVEKLNLNVSDKTENFGQVRADRTAAILLLNTTLTLPVNITLRSLSADEAQPSFEVAGYTLVLNDTLQLVDWSGLLYLAVSGNSTGNVEGVLSLTTANWVHPEEVLYTIKGQFVNYSIIENYKTMWFGYPVKCEGNDTGNLYTSSYLCEIRYPARINITELTLPTTVGQINDLKSKYAEDVGRVRQQASWISATNSFLILILIILIVVFSWKHFITPKWRFRWR